jgi:ribosomal protein L37AE/L43A
MGLAEEMATNEPVYDPILQTYVADTWGGMATQQELLRPWPLWKKNKREKRRQKHTWHCRNCGASWWGTGMYRNAMVHQELTGHQVEKGAGVK